MVYGGLSLRDNGDILDVSTLEVDSRFEMPTDCGLDVVADIVFVVFSYGWQQIKDL